jgi:serine/threonine protein phosphatase PrpC
VRLFLVADGHGPAGHKVSEFLMSKFPDILKPSVENIENGLHTVADVLMTKAFSTLNNELKRVKFDILSSGSTLNCILVEGNKVICANTGDSRAFIAI